MFNKYVLMMMITTRKIKLKKKLNNHNNANKY